MAFNSFVAGSSPFTPTGVGGNASSPQPTFAMPFDTADAGGPSANSGVSNQHGSVSGDSRGFDVFGRRVDTTFPSRFMNPTGSQRTSRSASRVNSPRPSNPNRSHGADTERDDRRDERRDRRDERTEEEPVGMRQRMEAIELTLRQHTSDIAALKTVGHGLQCQTDSAGVDMSHLVKKLDKSFADWNSRIASV